MEAVNEQAYCVDLYVYVMCIMCHSEAALSAYGAPTMSLLVSRCLSWCATCMKFKANTVSVWTDGATAKAEERFKFKNGVR